MKIKSQRDFLAGLFFITLGVLFAIGASRYPLGGSAHPGAGFFPLILSGLLAVLGASVLFKSLTIETEGGDAIGKIAWRPLVLVTGSVASFGLVLPRLGSVATIALLVFVVALAGEGNGWRHWAVRSVALSIFGWLVLAWWLKLDAPLWPAAWHGTWHGTGHETGPDISPALGSPPSSGPAR